MLKGLIGGLIAGLIGAAVWAAVAYFTGWGSGWIAWGIGALIGFVAAKAAGEEAGDGLGILAALIAVLAILGGKYATAHVFTQKILAEAPAHVVDDDYLLRLEATKVAEEWEKNGKTLAWPSEKDIVIGSTQSEFPPDVWEEATKRWDATPLEERERIRAGMKADYANFCAALPWKMFKASFSLWDILFIGLALFSAFKLGSGDFD
jgi:phosphate/sulfate permease